ncbi:dermonecrotic toxin domain-containing protein [Stenotrophomonas oahuensis]|uniref:Dermonecrotic toxin N-terminal domain-containing protein n=1 Tax=Stenotrophomonas oahuensis TaxID=3003271 RepID=A0ABY9YKI6_9GAMM|nr:DUF6543 domain-containing protein [Stenotrophomonas sp. A5586]WNH51394.1 hypothetical protein PDM29_13610 [Stenotrophomonas sp. A5586]
MQALVERILCTGAPQAETVVGMLRRKLEEVDEPETRAAIMARFEQALIGEPGWADAMASLTRNTLQVVFNRTGWSVLSAAMPTTAALLAGAQLLQQRSWSGVAAVLAALAPGLPTLRSHAEFEALVQSLPVSLRDSLATLNDWVEAMDAPFAPRLQLAPALAVLTAALLWQLQRMLPEARAPRHGVAAFVAALPMHWGKLIGLWRPLGGLLAPPPSQTVPRLITWLRDRPGEIVPAASLPLSAAAVVPLPAKGGSIVDIPDDHAGAVRAASGAARTDLGLLGLGGSLMVAGLTMIHQGWKLVFVNVPAATPDTAPIPDSYARPVAEVIPLLDEIVDVSGNATVWEDIYTRIDDAPLQSVDALVEMVQQRLIANALVDEVLVAPTRVRRAVNDHSPLPAPALNQSVQVNQRDGLLAASKQLVDAAQALPSGPAQPEEAVVGNENRVALAMARMHLRRWMHHHGGSRQQQHAALEIALRALTYSDKQLERVSLGLPNLDRHIATELVQQIQSSTNLTVDPHGIYLNTFSESFCWPDWEARQVPGPDPAMRGWYSTYPRNRRIRSGLISSDTLVEATLLPPKTDAVHSGLYNSGVPGTHFPIEEVQLTLGQFNDAINGSDYLGSFQNTLSTFIGACEGRAAHAERDAYLEAMRQRLAGTSTLLNAMGHLDEAGLWLIDTLLRYPTQFGTGTGNTTLGRALALPGQDIQVHALNAQPAGGGTVPLYGLVLAESQPSPERRKGAVVLISPTRLPLVEQFTSQADALQRLAGEVPHQLHSWVPLHLHARWSAGNGPVVLGTSVDDDLLRALLLQQLNLRSERLNHTRGASAADTRKDYLALDRRLLALPPSVATPMLTAANEAATASGLDPYDILGVHWLVQLGVPSRGVLRNAEVEDARWLNSMATTRGLLEFSYPLPVRYVADALERAILNQTRVAIDTTAHYLVRFSGGTANVASPSGFVHDANQKTGACRLVECAFDKAKGYPDGAPGSSDLGIYTADNSTVYDQDTEVDGLLPGLFLSVVRGLDLRSGYLDAIAEFWKTQRDEVKVCLRGVYMFSAWQQFAEGSLSAHGLQLAISATGYMLAAQAEDRAFRCHMADGSQVSWVSIYGAQSTLMRIDHQGGSQVLLYSPGDNVAFREFSDAAQLSAWLGRVVNSLQGRSWLEASFDLADLQDGWFSNGVSSTLGKAPEDLFKGNSTGPAINGEDLFDAMATRLEQRTVNDADTLLSSNWETWRDLLQRRLQVFDLVVGLVSIPLPALIPVVAVGAGIEMGLGIEKSVDGRTQADRHDGAVDAAWGAAGVALTAPFAMGRTAARTAALSTEEGLRLVPAVQAITDAAEVARVDPLARLSARYAQPAGLVVEGARPADNGIYHFAGRHYIRQAGNVYEVSFDKFNRTWRLKNPNPGLMYQDPVRLNADGLWEPHTEVGLRGGSPDQPYVSRSTSADASYVNAVQVEMQRSTQSLDSAGADFRWGRTHWERVALPYEVQQGASLARMKELFVSGRLEPAQRGAMSAIIARLERTMRIERALRVEEAVAAAVEANEGALIPVSQMMLETGQGTRMGWCTGMSRMLALGMAEGKLGVVIRNLRRAMRRPNEGLGAELLGAVRDAQGAALLPGTASAHAPIEYTDIGRFLNSVKGDAQFFLTGTSHHMVAAVSELPNGVRVFEVGDPNIGVIRFYKLSKFNRFMRYLFGSRYFSALSGSASRAGRETLAEMYGATRATSQGAATQFMIRQVDPQKLIRQARARGWDRLLRDVPD